MASILLFFLVVFLIGLLPYRYLRDVLKTDNPIVNSVFVMVLGLSELNLVFLLLGHFQLPVFGNYFFWTTIFVLLASSITIWIINVYRTIYIVEVKKLLTLDNLLLVVFIIYFIYVSLLNTRYYFPSWDQFTYWLLDAKIIFETGAFRSKYYHDNLMNIHSYSSLYPMQAVYIYKFYGRIAEQYASFITIFYALSATIICYSGVLKKSIMTKILVFTSLMVVNYFFLMQQNLILTFYSEVYISCLVLLFFYVLFSENSALNKYYKKFIILLILLFFIYLVKSPTHIFYTLILLSIWFSYEYKLLINNKKNILFNLLFFVPIIIAYFIYIYEIQGSFLVFKYFYNRNFIGLCLFMTALGFFYFKLKDTKVFSKGSYIFILLGLLFALLIFYSHDNGKNIVDTIKYVYSGLNYMIPLTVISFLLFAMSEDNKKKLYLLWLCIVLMPLLPIYNYVSSGKNLQSGSLFRYMSTVLFLIPLGISMTTQKIKHSLIIKIFVGINFLIMLYLFLFNNSFSLIKNERHTGEYKDFIWQKDFYLVSEKVHKVIGKNTITLVDVMLDPKGVSSKVHGVYGSFDIPSIYYRYYLSDNYIGGQYGTKDIFTYLSNYKSDYILIPNPNEYLLKNFNIAVDFKQRPCLIKVIDLENKKFKTVSY